MNVTLQTACETIVLAGLGTEPQELLGSSRSFNKPVTQRMLSNFSDDAMPRFVLLFEQLIQLGRSAMEGESVSESQ